MELMVAAFVCARIASCLVGEGGNIQRRMTFYVSKLGDNSDGRSWATAFHTIQQALQAIPDDSGGHRVIVRPDTYFEAMLYPAHKGAPGAYNELIGDVDGRFGSGTQGWVVIDSSDPEQRGFKSYDWWGPIKAYKRGWSREHTEPTFSAIVWDRWRLRGLYLTGGDGGIFFDLVDQVKPFSVIVEDCVGIGRAFGGGVANCLSRPDEPIVFRRCYLWALDWWGDTAAGYVRVENNKMPDRPDVIFEDCVMVGPQCSLKIGNFGFHTFSRVLLRRCKLVTLNFSQPRGTPTDGIIQSVQEGKYAWVDFEDCTLMGYKVFGVIVNKDTASDIRYTVSGDVKAYVQFQQEVPQGMHRLGHWPKEVFDSIVPPSLQRPAILSQGEVIAREMCELAPFLWRGRLHHLECVRPAKGGQKADYYLVIRDGSTGEEVARFATGYGLSCIIVHEGKAYVFASRWDDGWRDVTVFVSSDLKHWRRWKVIEGKDEQIFNTSVCRGPNGFVMAYETNDSAYPPFTIKFARSQDLLTWEPIPGAIFGKNRYTACPCIRYANGYFYMLYLEHRKPRWFFETYIARSKDLRTWELSLANPVLTPRGLDEGVNASDPEVIEIDGTTYVYYAVGDQRTWSNVKRAVYQGSIEEFFEKWFKNGAVPYENN